MPAQRELVGHLLGREERETRHPLERVAAGDDVQIPGAVRPGIGIGGTEDDVDALLDALRAMGRGLPGEARRAARGKGPC